MKAWVRIGVVAVMAAALLAACGDEGGSTADTIEKPAKGKADDGAIGELCVELGQAADCDLCEEAGWYGDGECDDFCAQPDPDCGGDIPANGATCAFDLTSPVGETSGDLDEFIVGSTSFTIDDIDALSAVQSAQIGDAFILLELLGDEDFDVVFDIADDGEIEIIELDTGAAGFDWVKFFAGDTEVGVVYEAGTLNRVGEISDGDIKGCAVGDVPNNDPNNSPNNDPNNDPGEAVCSFDKVFPVAETSGELRDLATNEREITDIDIPGLSELESQQIFRAALHLEAIDGGEDFDVVFDAVDDGTFFLLDVEAEAGSFDWVRFFLGDTEVGVIYEIDTLNIVAEVGDGDILGCESGAAGE